MHAIAPYSIRFYDPNSNEKNIEDRYSKLDKIGAYDAFKVLEDYVNRLDDKFVIVEETKQVYRFKGMKTFPERRQVAGWFEVGSYGVKNDIIDIKTGNVDYKKTQENAEIIRHYVRFFVPVGFNEGIALLHSFKGGGIKTLLHDLLRVEFLKITRLNMQMNPLAYKKAFVAWEKAYAKELRLTKFEGMNDITDQIKRLGHKEQQLVIKPPSRASLGRFKDYLDPNSEEYKVVEYLSPMCAHVKVVFELDGKKRTFTIGRPADEQVCEIAIDEEDVDFVAGNPESKSLHKWCTRVLQDLADSLYPKMGVKV
ncbi:hypothetical protein SAMN05660489_05976 [Pseudomonas sp. LAMO17WK12:I10]|uniref:hypothetical protein n=1 Tax=unclassified Pseudomonas TaxID=196821 RepID=UPI000BD8C618|nr:MULTISPECIES: hypothetical protein [unclassified Pseudomonas]PXX53266.1 hypothetical protein H160_05969 [Pseudomonas sp. LAMO17WK12:I9]SNY52388.1 hypothetical protein SAMN05660489_05976 [Pseudomonas sp. LAMO17WK12:I10]